MRRVLQVHTRYRQPGGEDQVVAAEHALLSAAGAEVRQVLFDNAELRESRSPLGDIGLALDAIWSRAARARVDDAIRSFRPEVVHVHNTFAAASPSVYGAARRAGIPVVQTLHNYRLVCPAAIPFRDGHPCTDCVGQPVPLPGLVHACVRGSRAQSAVVVAMLAVHRAARTWTRGIDAYITLTEFQRRLILRGGLLPDRVRVIPNFLEPDPGTGVGTRSGILFVGRLSVEKGVTALMGAARALPGLVRVAGDGPLGAQVHEAAAAGLVEELGVLDAAAVRSAMQRAQAVVLPGITFEGFPMVLVEAFATGTPVIASRIGSLGELVEEGETGLLAVPGDAVDLAGRMAWAVEHPAEMAAMGARARQRYEARYRGTGHLAALQEIYGAAAAHAAARTGARKIA